MVRRGCFCIMRGFILGRWGSVVVFCCCCCSLLFFSTLLGCSGSDLSCSTITGMPAQFSGLVTDRPRDSSKDNSRSCRKRENI